MRKFLIKLIFIILIFCFIGVDVNALDTIDDSSYYVYINDEDISNYDLLGDNKVKITQVYNGDNNGCVFENGEEFIIDYSNKLYGIYDYSFSLVCDGEVVDTKDISINYLGNNDSIINSNNIYYRDNEYYILGGIDSEITTLDVINLFNSNISVYNANIDILNSDGNRLLDNELVSSGNKLTISGVYEEYGDINIISSEFDINVVMDNNGDSIIDIFDIKSMFVDKLLNGDSSFDVMDIVNIGNSEIIPSSDKLNQYVEYEDVIFVGDEFIYKYYLSGFDIDTLSGIMGDIIYDREVLELVDIEINSIYGKYNSSNFVYLLDNYNLDGLFITLEFKTLKEGSSNISLDNLSLVSSSGGYLEVIGDIYLNKVFVIESGKGGDSDEKVEIEEKEPEIDDDNVVEEVVVKKEGGTSRPVIVYEELLPFVDNASIKLSNDNYIDSLEIKGYEIDFNRDILEYNIKVDNDVEKLDFEITLSDRDSYYLIEGNRKFKVGDNKVVIMVTSEDGSNRNYVINVYKSGDMLEEAETIGKEVDSSKNIIILLMILIIIGLICIIVFDEND